MVIVSSGKRRMYGRTKGLNELDRLIELKG
jgi:hypothetical protein